MHGIFYQAYTCFWLLFCLMAIMILLHDRKQLRPEWTDYFRFLCVPWKLFLFLPALLFITFAGRFTNDETWDVISGSGMSILTFLTAPWAIGLIFQTINSKRSQRYLIVAVALCLFSSSWFYDGYLYLRDGAYTSRWFGNLVLSPIIYVSAGLLWNLEAKKTGGIMLSFFRDDWPKAPENKSFRPLLLVSIPLILVAAYVLVAFVNWHF